MKRLSGPALLIFLGSVLACQEATEPESQTFGEIAVTVRTVGSLPDADGYVLVIDNRERIRVAINSDTVLSLREGRHHIYAEDLAGDCAVLGEGGWLRFISAESRSLVQLEVGCFANGGLTITTRTTGVDADSDGYLLLLGGDTLLIGDATPVHRTVRPRDYSIQLRGVAGNCSVAGGIGRNMYVAELTEMTVAYEVECRARPLPSPGEFIVVSSWDPAEDLDLYAIALDGSWSEKLTDHPAGDYAPTVSPVGGRIAFLRQLASELPSVILLDLASRVETRLSIASEYPVNWSPDGNHLVVNRHGELVLVDIRDGSVRSLGVLADGEAYWSPDGTRLAFTLGGHNEHGRVRVVNADGSNNRILTDQGWREAGPWSPDGKTLLLRAIGPGFDCYWGDCWDEVSLNAFDLATGREHTLMHYVDFPQWGPEGDRIYVLQNGGVHSMRIDDGELIRVGGLPANVTSFGIGRLR